MRLELVLAIQQSCESSGLYVCHKIPRIPPVISEGKVTKKGSGSGKYTMEPDKAISEADWV